MAQLNIKNSYMVRPAKPTWHGSQLLSEIDQIGEMTHNLLVYFYKPPITSPHYSNIPDTLKDSLSQVLVPFYPVAGRLRWIDRNDHQHQGRLELDCNGNGVKFIDAELDVELAEFGGLYLSPNHQYLFPAVDYSVPIHELPILLVQLTKFKCGGISLGMALSHVVADGSCIAHFMVEWARFARGESTRIEMIVPLHDRNALQTRERPAPFSATTTRNKFDHFKDLTYCPELIDHKEVKNVKRTVVRLRLTQNQAEKLKKLSNECRSPNLRPYTTYEAIGGHLWQTICKVRKNKDEQPTAFIISIDLRRRLQPPLPDGYFGNAILDASATSFSGDLVLKPLGYAASEIRAAINKITDEYIVSTIDYLKKQKDLAPFRALYLYSPDDILGDPNFALTSWLNLPLYGIDFGWGKELCFEPGDLKIDGGSVILRSGEGDGSLIILVCLLAEHVDAFNKYFYQDIMISSSL